VAESSKFEVTPKKKGVATRKVRRDDFSEVVLAEAEPVAPPTLVFVAHTHTGRAVPAALSIFATPDLIFTKIESSSRT
jgi:hypothetical protein